MLQTKLVRKSIGLRHMYTHHNASWKWTSENQICHPRECSTVHLFTRLKAGTDFLYGDFLTSPYRSHDFGFCSRYRSHDFTSEKENEDRDKDSQWQNIWVSWNKDWAGFRPKNTKRKENSVWSGLGSVIRGIPSIKATHVINLFDEKVRC